MSSPLAIASVTRVLKDLLNNRMIDHDVSDTTGNVKVTALPPDFITTGMGSEESQLNLFMYMVTPNPGWSNQRFPSRNANGDRITNPPLALDLHYLLTAYGAEEHHSEILLGYGMQLFHEYPILAREAIRTALAPSTSVSPGTLPAELQSLATAGLADQFEQIKITPEALNTEELSRLWTAFGAKYRPTATYRVTVVLIESTRSTKSALPVRDRQLYVKPFHQPIIEKISSRTALAAATVDAQKIIPGYFLVIQGKQLRADIVSVQVGTEEVLQASFSSLTDEEIIFPIPAALAAGIHAVQIQHSIPMGIESPPLAHKGVSSNVEAFVLSPAISALNFIDGVEVAGIWSGTIEVTVTPALGINQRMVLLLNEFNAAAGSPALAFSFEMLGIAVSSPPAANTVIPIAISNVPTGSYLVRVQVDGAESPLQTNASLAYSGPIISIS